ncbi:MAG: hypothetical protein NT159_06385 [Proteobacteria bacterium]|nr:hypothetical protein [Pseudomonadota bacterium]
MQIPSPCLSMRDGISRGPFFKAGDPPADIAAPGERRHGNPA